MYRLPTKRVYAAVPNDAFEAVCDLSLRERRAAKDTAGLLIEEALNARGLLQRKNAHRADQAAAVAATT